MSADNKSLGKFILDGIPPSPRGVPQIEVTFDIDANGILNVTAKDKATGKEQSIHIEGSSGLSKEEVEKLKKEAELHREEDEKKKGNIEIKNNAESLVYTTEKTLKDAGEKVPADLKAKIEDKVKELKEVLKNDDFDIIKTKTEELSQSLQEVGTHLYQQQKQEEEKGKPEEKESNKNDKDNKSDKDAKDADFEEK
jgi:molecular chaperone DnaK